jgi:hypothetical protein
MADIVVPVPSSAPRVAAPTDRTLTRVTTAAAAGGAALIHAAVIGPHLGHGWAPGLFAVAAVTGLASAVALVVRPARTVVALVGAAHLVMVLFWLLTRTVGVGFLPGFEESEAISLADGTAAGFAVMVVAGSAMLLRPHRGAPIHPSVAASAVAPVVVAFSLLAAPAMYQAAVTPHAHGTDGGAHAVSDHDHGTGATGSERTGAGGSENGAPAPHPAAKPFDPAAPIDLGGTEGVTQVQQKQAELLLARTLAELPRFADREAAIAAGYRSIGDGATGAEHLIKWELINDDVILDPSQPESLVYRTRGPGAPKLQAAMFILPDGYTLDNVPDIGGSLIQWHIHNNLCFTPPPDLRVAAVTSENGPCRPPLIKFDPHPMIHVWIEKHPCGPFAALEGVAGGQVKPGETKACDHAHGSSGTF